MSVGAGLYHLDFVTSFSKSFLAIYNWKNLSAYLVIFSGNSHLLSSALKMVLTFFGTIESSSLLPNTGEELDDWHGEEDIFLDFSSSSLIFSFPPFMESLLPQDFSPSRFWVYYCSAVRWPMQIDNSICYHIFCLCLGVLHKSIHNRNYKSTIIGNCFFWWCFWHDQLDFLPHEMTPQSLMIFAVDERSWKRIGGKCSTLLFQLRLREFNNRPT